MLGTVGKEVTVQVQTPNHLERDLFTVIWKRNQYLILWKVLEFNFTVCIYLYIYLFQNNCFNS